jgi:hypothetical protein
MADRALELNACQPSPLNPKGFNTALNQKGLARFESFLMAANFSSIVGELMTAGIPFSSSGPKDASEGKPPRPFALEKVVGAKLLKSDWEFSGRSETSRRTITASVTNTGHEKMMKSWIYKADPSLLDQAELSLILDPSDLLGGRLARVEERFDASNLGEVVNGQL